MSQSSQCQRDAVRNREGCDRTEQLGFTSDQEDQREDKQKMVPS
eukprot:CAMPEP_0184439246 /NCGR_PEP_ID=MMETSP0738-20130409/699331_1 /TAXON_ID=385413 /ORGANISM="Thalassiosira miniscula, Strain CCMP1093" /LENGTH=43 /DNA_ID= /DNA_START= /DNA_END= /DNA_ORIENTATION=